MGCSQKGDCPSEQACVNSHCINPCDTLSPCGDDAQCQSTPQGPVCSCPEGFMGDPYSKCHPAECSQDSQCPNHKQCQNQQCEDPCKTHHCVANAECRVQDHKAVCRCLTGYEGDPDRFCSPVPQPECQSDYDCQELQGCVLEECQDLCLALHPCGSDAVCQVLPNHPVKIMSCTCPEGYDGNPHFACNPSKYSITKIYIIPLLICKCNL